MMDRGASAPHARLKARGPGSESFVCIRAIVGHEPTNTVSRATPLSPYSVHLNCGGPFEAPEFWRVGPPIGAVTPILPDGAAYEYVNGVSYYTRGGAYYRPRVTRNGILFEVVRTPS
jgi:hypothetical protein